jgi:exodeoxyribonuclease VII large subunit
MVAHTALKTPTAAANFLIDRLLWLDQQLAGAAQRLQQEQTRILQAKSTVLERIEEQVRSAHQQLVKRQAWQLEQYATQLPLLVNQRLRRATEQLDQLTRLHELLSLSSQLKRGFALVSSGDRILTSTAELAKQENITIHLKDGTVSIRAKISDANFP